MVDENRSSILRPMDPLWTLPLRTNGCMQFPKVSVLIPCYNAEKYVGETLESVFRQTWPEVEVIVVDDGSTDQSVRVIQSFARPNLRLLQQANRGSTAARNVCCSHATGEFVQYL